MRHRLGDQGPQASPTLQTADRALQVLQLFGTPDEALGVGDIARRLGIHRSSASRLVSTLRARRFLERSGPGERLRLGVEVERLGRLALVGRVLIGAAQPILQRLAAETGETATLATAAGGEVMTVAQADGRHFVSSGRWVGVRAPAHCGSDGKVLLAYGALEVRGERLARLTPRTITERDVLERQLTDVRERGYALSDGELEDGLVGIAVPVLEDGSCVASLCVSGPAYRLNAAAIELLLPICRHARTVLERRLAGPGTGCADEGDLIRAELHQGGR